jgi:hypothetical protein
MTRGNLHRLPLPAATDNQGHPLPRLRTTRPVAIRALAGAASAFLIALSGCATPATRTETVEVKVPVAVQPITPAQVPTPPAPLGPRPSSLSAAADALFAQVCKLEAYVLRADPLLRVSAGEKPAELPKYPECEGR